MRTCRKCGQTKAESEFQREKGQDGKFYQRGECKECRAVRYRAYASNCRVKRSGGVANKRAYFARVLAGLKLER